MAWQTGYLEILSHAFLTADHQVQATVFADGTKVWVNFGEKPYGLKGGAILSPKSWKVVYPKGVDERGVRPVPWSRDLGGRVKFDLRIHGP